MIFSLLPFYQHWIFILIHIRQDNYIQNILNFIAKYQMPKYFRISLSLLHFVLFLLFYRRLIRVFIFRNVVKFLRLCIIILLMLRCRYLLRMSQKWLNLFFLFSQNIEFILLRRLYFIMRRMYLNNLWLFFIS